MENRTFDIPSLHEQFLNSFGSPPLRNIEWNCVSVSEIVRSSLRRLYFVPRDYEFEKSESDSKFAKRSPRIYSSTRVVAQSSLLHFFVMNYKVASLEIIRGSRDPVFFFIFLIHLISSKRTKWLFEWKDRNYFVSLVNSFSYLNLIFDKKFLNIFHVFKIYCSDNCSWIYVFSFLTIEVNIVEVNILWNSLGWLLFFFSFFFLNRMFIFLFSLFISVFLFFSRRYVNYFEFIDFDIISF